MNTREQLAEMALRSLLRGYADGGPPPLSSTDVTPDEEIASLVNFSYKIADAMIAARLTDMGGMALTGSPADFGKLITDETEKWGKVIRDAGIKAE